MLSPAQWEMLCAEYLRDLIGFRSLLVAPGRGLRDFDLLGVDMKGNRILVQCKNDSTSWSAEDVQDWLVGLKLAANDVPVFCCRGGVSGEMGDSHLAIVTGAEVASWLAGQGEYQQALRRL